MWMLATGSQVKLCGIKGKGMTDIYHNCYRLFFILICLLVDFMLPICSTLGSARLAILVSTGGGVLFQKTWVPVLGNLMLCLTASQFKILHISRSWIKGRIIMSSVVVDPAFKVDRVVSLMVIGRSIWNSKKSLSTSWRFQAW
jgi:hypothetical protein